MKLKITKYTKINVTNAIQDEVGNAKKFVHSFEDIQKVIEAAEKRLNAFGIPKNKRIGVSVINSPEGPSKSYRYSAAASRIKLYRGTKDWFLTDVERIKIWPDTASVFNIIINEDHVLVTEADWKRKYGISVFHPTGVHPATTNQETEQRRVNERPVQRNQDVIDSTGDMRANSGEVTKPAQRPIQVSPVKEFKPLFAASERGFRPARMRDENGSMLQVSHLPVEDGYLVLIPEDGKPLPLATDFTLGFTSQLTGSSQISRICFVDKETGKNAFEQLMGNTIAQYTSIAA